MKIAIAADHTGYTQLQDVKKFLETLGHQCQNFGPKVLDSDDDFPDFIAPAAKSVSDGVCDKGIIMGGSGQGEAMVANRTKGIRCAVFYGTAVAKTAIDAEGHQSFDPYEVVRLSRQHNDANMLSIGVRFVSQMEIAQVIKIWLETAFSGQERHVRRIKKLETET